MEREETVMNKQEILEADLHTLPEKIKEQELKILGFTNNITMIERDLQKIDHFTMAAVIKAKETVPSSNGYEDVQKKKFTNQTARDIELDKRLQKNDIYIEKKKSINDSKIMLSKARIELNYLNNSFSAKKYLVRLFIGGEENGSKERL